MGARERETRLGKVRGSLTGPARGPLLLVLVVALVVRLVALGWAEGAELQRDERTYVQRAHALLDGKGLLGSYQSVVRHEGRFLANLPQYPGAYQPPGYPAFLAAVLAISGRNLDAARFAQVVLGTLTVLLLYAIGASWLDPRRGLVAAWICALYPNLIAYSHLLWSETLFVFLLLLALWRLGPRLELASRGSFLWAGCVLGAAILTRSSTLYLLPLLVVWWVAAHRERRREVLVRGALLVAASLLVVAPWVLRNQRLHGGFVLVDTNAPFNLWRGNGPDTFRFRADPRTAHYDWPFENIPVEPVFNRTAARLVKEFRRDRGIQQPSDLELTRYAREMAWARIRERPGEFVGRAGTKLVDTWNPTSFLVRHFHLGGYGDVAPWRQAAISWSAIVSYVAVMALALPGLVLGRRSPILWLALLLLLFYSGISAVAFGLTRFRVAAMPLLMLAAAETLCTLAAAARRPRRLAG